jgi:SOS-response transcriptional repressor LexA
MPMQSFGHFLPLYNYIPAGNLESAFEIFMHGKCDLNSLLLGTKSASIFYVQGISPEIFGLDYGDLVIVQKDIPI